MGITSDYTFLQHQLLPCVHTFANMHRCRRSWILIGLIFVCTRFCKKNVLAVQCTCYITPLECLVEYDLTWNYKTWHQVTAAKHSTMGPFHYSTNANVSLHDNTKTFGILSCKSVNEWRVSYHYVNISKEMVRWNTETEVLIRIHTTCIWMWLSLLSLWLAI